MRKIIQEGPPDLLWPDEAAAMLRIDPKTLTRWAKSGVIPPSAFIRLPSGHRRYRRAAIEAILHGQDGESHG